MIWYNTVSSSHRSCQLLAGIGSHFGQQQYEILPTPIQYLIYTEKLHVCQPISDIYGRRFLLNTIIFRFHVGGGYAKKHTYANPWVPSFQTVRKPTTQCCPVDPQGCCDATSFRDLRKQTGPVSYPMTDPLKMIYLPTWIEHTYPTKRETEHHRLKSALGEGYVSFQEGIFAYMNGRFLWFSFR